MASLPDISAHLHTSQGFCYPDWTAIFDVIEQQVPEAEWNAAWETAARTWVDRIRSHLGGNYNIYETANFLILSEAPMRVIKDACRSYEDSGDSGPLAENRSRPRRLPFPDPLLHLRRRLDRRRQHRLHRNLRRQPR